MKKIKVLVCDDSRIMRKLITNVIETDERIEVVGQAENGVECLEKCAQFQPEVVTLDLNMPVMDGLTVLREAKARGLQTSFLVVSSLAKKDAQITLDAITEGAIDFILKPSQAFNIASMGKEVIEKILIAALQAKKAASGSEGDGSPAEGVEAPVEAGPEPVARPQSDAVSALEAKAAKLLEQRKLAEQARQAAVQVAEEVKEPRKAIYVLGGSSGAIQTLLKVIPFISQDFDRTIFLVLHLPPFFTTQFTQQLNNKCHLPVEEASDTGVLEPRKIYIAPGGDKNIIVRRNPDDQIIFKLIENDANSLYTPSIDVLMASISELYGEDCAGVLISGTGSDGVEGLRGIKNSGGRTYVQDKATAIANQLPFAALKAGVVDKTLNIQGLLDLLS